MGTVCTKYSMTLTMWLPAAVTDTVSVPITHPGPGTRVVGSVAVLLQLTQSELSDSQSVNRTTLFSLSQTNYHSNHRYNHDS